ncbi:MAG: hypothetical protein JOZ62_05225 [Acidobacteriaceae bacterium]|nr:hypothetical protein [Acidobacteriaceae bacterium]
MPALVSRPASQRSCVAEVRNISRDGLFCFVNEPFNVGEIIHCRVVLPHPARKRDETAGLCIDGQFEVVHLLADRSCSSFGLGCVAKDFQVLPMPDVATGVAAPETADRSLESAKQTHVK